MRRLAVIIFVVNAIFVGAAIFARRLIPTHGDESSDTFALLASMSGIEFASRSQALSVGKATAFLGGIELDLRNAHIVDGAVLELVTVFGGIAVAVPPTWRVEVRQRALVGGVENNTDPDAAREGAPLLVIDASASFGGIAIGVKEPAAQETAPL
jgi:hypothetical protein